MTQTVADAEDGNRARTVTFEYSDGFRRMPSAMTFNGRTWNYDYDFLRPGTSEHLLTKVRPPAGRPWQFDYAAAGNEWSIGVTLPAGGTVTYDFDDEILPVYEGNHRLVVRSVTSGGRDVPSATWNFEYDQPAGEATGTATGPQGRKVVFEQVAAGRRPSRPEPTGC